MSRVTENAAAAVRESEFIFNDSRTMEVRNAYIFWTNFAGKENKWHNSARTFNLAVTEEVAEQLGEMGWRIRDVENDDGTKLYFVNIKLKMDSAYPPIINLFSEFRGKRSKRTLDAESVGELDHLDILSADCIINMYVSRQYPGKVTGYLKKLNVIQNPDIEFGGKYDDWDNEEDSPEVKEFFNQFKEDNPF